jgi:hypothetical protein
VEQHHPALVEHLAEQGKVLPAYIDKEFATYLKCGRLEHGFLRVRCAPCHFERLAAFSCKRRGFCPSCGARRMAETAALLADEVLPALPLGQWVISFPFALRLLFAACPDALARALEVIYRLIGTHLAHKAGFARKPTATGAVTLVQRFGSSVTYRIALGPQAGRKALVLRTIRPLAGEAPENERVAKAKGICANDRSVRRRPGRR